MSESDNAGPANFTGNAAFRTFTQGRGQTRTEAELARAHSSSAPIKTTYAGRRDSAGQTSGIPIFGWGTETPRTGWSVAHTKTRKGVGERLPLEQQRLAVLENSHALGHGDFGVDHFLSAPVATADQNTAQLAFETAMRYSARELNKASGVSSLEEHSRVRLKVSDTYHENGSLNVRRYQIHVRHPDRNWGDENGSRVAVDWLFDGRRQGISEDEFDNLALGVTAAMFNPDGPGFSNIPDESELKRDGSHQIARSDISGQELRDHQAAVHVAYNSEAGEAKTPRSAIQPFSPALTDVTIRNNRFEQGQDPRPALQEFMAEQHDIEAEDWNQTRGYQRDARQSRVYRAQQAQNRYQRLLQQVDERRGDRPLDAVLRGMRDGTEGQRRQFADMMAAGTAARVGGLPSDGWMQQAASPLRQDYVDNSGRGNRKRSWLETAMHSQSPSPGSSPSTSPAPSPPPSPGRGRGGGSDGN